MSAHPCDAVRERLEAAFWARREPVAADAAHAGGCAACGALRADLVALARALDAEPAPRLRPEVESAARERARAALREPARGVPVPSRRELPAGYRGELLRLLAVAALPLPLALACFVVAFRLGGWLLDPWLPPALVAALGVAYATLAASWLALIYGALPVVAHRRSLRRASEVTA